MKTMHEMYENLSGKAKVAIAAGAVVASGLIGGLVGYAMGEKSGYARHDNELFREWLGEDSAFHQAGAEEMKALDRIEGKMKDLTDKLDESNDALNSLSGSQSFKQWLKESK